MNTTTNNNMTTNTTSTTSATTFVPASAWIDPEECRAIRKRLIEEGVDKKLVKLSSYRWVDVKDHDKGYLARVMIAQGVRPDLEVAPARKKAEAPAQTCETGNSGTDAQTIMYYVAHKGVSGDSFTN